MYSTKLHFYLKNLNSYQWNRFMEFVGSDYFNKKQPIRALCLLLSSFYKKNKIETLEKVAIWKSVYGKIKFSDLTYRRLCTDTQNLLEQFFALEDIQNHAAQYRLCKVNALQSRHLYKYLQADFFQCSKESQTLYSFDEMQIEHKMNMEKTSFFEANTDRFADKNIQNTRAGLDDYFLAVRFRLYAAELHYGLIKSNTTQDTFIESLLHYARQHTTALHPVAAIYYHIIEGLLHPATDDYYHSLSRLISRHSDKTAHALLKDIFAFAINYCIRKINSGDTHFQNELLTLYKQMLEKKLLFVHNEISPFDYKNIVTVSLRCKEFLWAEKFILQYKNYLPASHQENAVNFNMARLFFSEKKYKEVLPLLQNVEYNDVFYLLDSKTTLFKTYYEMGEFYAMQSLAESFTILLRRKKIISEQHRVNYTNFLKISMKIYRADTAKKKAIEKLAETIRATKGIADKGWITEKFKEIGGDL